MRWILSVIACAFPMAATASSPIAEVICEPSEKMQTRLVHQFGTQRQASGLRGPEQVMEVWTDDDGDWTMVIRYATGNSCIVAMGEHWHSSADQDPA